MDIINTYGMIGVLDTKNMTETVISQKIKPIISYW